MTKLHWCSITSVQPRLPISADFESSCANQSDRIRNGPDTRRSHLRRQPGKAGAQVMTSASQGQPSLTMPLCPVSV